MRIIIVWVKAWSSKCLVAAVGVASGNISRSLRPKELRPKDPKKTQNSKGKQIRSVVCVCLPDLNIRGKWVVEEEEEQSERTGFLTEIGEGTVIPITLFPCLLLLAPASSPSNFFQWQLP